MTATITMLPTGRTLNLDPFPRQTTVGEIKALAANRLLVPVREQRLLLGGASLEDDGRRLGDLCSGAVATLVLTRRKKPERIPVKVALPPHGEPVVEVWVSPDADGAHLARCGAAFPVPRSSPPVSPRASALLYLAARRAVA